MVGEDLIWGRLAGLSTPARVEPDCECPPEHSITELGHCRSCPWYHTLELQEVVASTADPPQQPITFVFICGRIGHADGTPHDFDWATYSDDTEEYGVCHCGASERDHMLWFGP